MSQLEFGDLRDTLRDEKERLLKCRDEGTHCRACGQFVKVYPRQIHSTIARALILGYHLSRRSKDGTFHINDIMRDRDTLKAYGDIQKTRMWDLLDPITSDEPPASGARTLGLWRFLPKGIDFIENKIQIPKYAYVYDNTLLGYSEEKTDIIKCLHKKFNYYELMNG
jgi:hypothetical protein